MEVEGLSVCEVGGGLSGVAGCVVFLMYVSMRMDLRRRKA